MLMASPRRTGFTIVELLIVIVIVGILAAISTVGYRGMQERAKRAAMISDLQHAAEMFELHKVKNKSYPTSMLDMEVSDGVVLSATNTSGDTFCLNAYYEDDPSLQVSWDSEEGARDDRWCVGAAIGDTIGGSVPTASRGVNLMPNFSHWTLTGGASYNSSSGELTLTGTSSAQSPLVRVDEPTVIKTGGDMYATVASASSSLAPNGGYHVSIKYFGSDGVTPAENTAGYTGNGCARAINLSSWQNGVDTCSFSGGPGIYYASYVFTGPSGGYTSAGLKIKNPLLVVSD